jgi:hypothetical protein
VNQLGLTDGLGFDYQVVPPQIWPYDPLGIMAWLPTKVGPQTPLLFLGFSAGVVGLLGAALAWQWSGGKVLGLIAVDGWGVPLVTDFPTYRLSHDRFTHESSAWLGAGSESFYAEPAAPHLGLWAEPKRVQGYWVINQRTQPTTAAVFLQVLFARHLS